jgi:uncharacterized protein (TIGR03437 family)
LAATFILIAIPSPAQNTTIGGGTCKSSSLKGDYSLSLTGRQTTTSPLTVVFTNVFQANGSATFDGLNKVTISLTADTLQGVAASLSWSGAYSMESDCTGQLTVSTGANITFNLLLYNGGTDFLVTGSDAVYSYTGSGKMQPASCSVTMLAGVYAFSATGYALGGTAASGVEDGGGLLQFDDQGKVTADITLWSSGAPSTTLTLTGTSALSNCLGSAQLTDSKSNAYSMSFSISAANMALSANLAQSGKFMLAGGAHAVSQGQLAASCSASNLNGTYSLSLSGRATSSTGSFSGSFQSVGAAAFDGQGRVNLTGTVNTNLAQGSALTYSGTYSVPSSCYGAITIPNGPSFTLLVWNNGRNFTLVGADATYVYSGAGSNLLPSACATSSISGEYLYSASGSTLLGTFQTGTADESGLLFFDGQGNVTGSYMVSFGGRTQAQPPLITNGTYTVTPGCLASAALIDDRRQSHTLNFAITGTYGQTLEMLESDQVFFRAGAAHVAFSNPTQSIANVASYAVNATPPGSIFALFGTDLATREAVAASSPLPTTLLNTSVTVNGELAPLFYVSASQINAQMPWEIPGNAVAAVIVKNGSSTSNAAAVFVPATGTPGIITYGDNRAVVVNKNGVTINSVSEPAAVGDVVVAYFTGGGPVQASGKLVTGQPAPSGLSPITGQHSVTVGDAAATVLYMGLTPGSIGLYQANFMVPQLPKGTYPVHIIIAGQASNAPVMTISN